MTDYEMIARQAEALTAGVLHRTANLANVSALLYDSLEDVNWAGFYLLEGGRLVLGPFQGKPACIHIPVGRGVCGTAVAEDRIQVVPDVHLFPGHIACDCASESEIVIPIHQDGKIIAVLDIDSPVKNRFSAEDYSAMLSELVRLMEQKLCWD